MEDDAKNPSDQDPKNSKGSEIIILPGAILTSRKHLDLYIIGSIITVILGGYLVFRSQIIQLRDRITGREDTLIEYFNKSATPLDAEKEIRRALKVKGGCNKIRFPERKSACFGAAAHLENNGFSVPGNDLE